MVGNVICVLSCEVLFLFQTASGILLCSVCSQIGDPSVKRQQIAKNVERLVQTLLSDSPTTKQEVSGKTSPGEPKHSTRHDYHKERGICPVLGWFCLERHTMQI
jgi:hypothetical protein